MDQFSKTDHIIAELWALLCPDMGPEEWKTAIYRLAGREPEPIVHPMPLGTKLESE